MRVRVNVAEMSVSGFRVADGEPLMGRVLVEADEQPAAPAVAVIGYEVWRTRFGSDPNVLGRAVQLGNEYATVVGVMREGFEFPVSHDVWLPLKTAVSRSKAALRPRDYRLCPARPRRNHANGASGVDDGRPARRDGVTRHASASRAPREALRDDGRA